MPYDMRGFLKAFAYGMMLEVSTPRGETTGRGAGSLLMEDTKLKKYNIEIPFPQRDLHLRSVSGQKDDAGLRLLNRQFD